MNPQVPETGPGVGDLADAKSERRLVFGRAALIPRRARELRQPTRSNPADLERFMDPGRQLAPPCRL